MRICSSGRPESAISLLASTMDSICCSRRAVCIESLNISVARLTPSTILSTAPRDLVTVFDADTQSHLGLQEDVLENI